MPELCERARRHASAPGTSARGGRVADARPAAVCTRHARRAPHRCHQQRCMLLPPTATGPANAAAARGASAARRAVCRGRWRSMWPGARGTAGKAGTGRALLLPAPLHNMWPLRCFSSTRSLLSNLPIVDSFSKKNLKNWKKKEKNKKFEKKKKKKKKYNNNIAYASDRKCACFE